MNRDKIYELHEIVEELSNYKYRFLQEKTSRMKELLEPFVAKEKERDFRRERNLSYSYEGYDTKKTISHLLDGFVRTISLHDEAKKELDYYSKEMQDILHAIELLDLSEEELLEHAKKIKEIREKRRQAKDFLNSVNPLYEFAVNHSSLTKELREIASKVDKNENHIENRSYNPRVMTQMELAFKKAQEKTEAV